MLKLLIVEDDPGYLAELQADVLPELGRDLDVRTAADLEKAEAALRRHRPDLVVLDMVFPLRAGQPPAMDAGRRLVDAIRREQPGARAVALSGQDRDFAVKLLVEKRIDDFLFKDSDWEEIRARLAGHVGAVRAARAGSLLEAEVAGERGPRGVVAADPVMQQVLGVLERVAKTDSTVMLTGESGTGKEVLARRLHDLSPRHASPFVGVNCGAIEEALVGSELFGHVKGAFTGAASDRAGKFEVAHGGTLFLDEIGELSLSNQVRLLRVLEERVVERVGANAPIECNVRVVTATHRNLEDMVAQGKFREDLLFRLNVFPLAIPPLRQRPGDIEALARHFLGVHAKRMGRAIRDIEPALLDRLRAYAWPGNVRQLRNVIEHAVILEPGATLTAESLPPLPGMRPAGSAGASSGAGFRPGRSYLEHLDDFERAVLTQAMRAHGNDTAKVAQALSMPLRTLQRRLKAMGVSGRD